MVYKLILKGIMAMLVRFTRISSYYYNKAISRLFDVLFIIFVLLHDFYL